MSSRRRLPAADSMPKACATGLLAMQTSRGSSRRPTPPRRQASTAYPASSSAARSPCRARSRRSIWRRQSITPCGNTPSAKPPNKPIPSGRLGWLGERHQVAQDRQSPAQARLGLLPIVEEHDLHVGPHPCGAALIANEGHQAIGIGKGTIAERDHRAFGTGLDPFDVGLPAERLDADDLQKVLDFCRKRPETIDQLGPECFDLAFIIDLGEPQVEREP